MADPKEVIRVLREAGVRFVLMGTHGLVGYRKQVRATLNVDVLVRKADHKKAIKALQAVYPELKVVDTPVVTRFMDPTTGEPAIVLRKPSSTYLQKVFGNSVAIGESHRIPTLEMALVTKFAAMTSPHRDSEKKHVDAGDFIRMVKQNQDEIDRKKLKTLANLVYPGGAKEIELYIEDVKSGRTLEL